MPLRLGGLSSRALLLAALFGAGCSLSHDGSGDLDAGSPRSDAGSPRSDAGSPRSDAGSAAPDAGSRDAGSPTIPVDACERAAAGELDVPCDPDRFEPCSRPVAGIPCCELVFTCEAGRVVAGDGFCDDSCAQGCPLITEAFDCAASACEWFVGGCGPAPDGVVEGPRCVWPRGAACETDAECDASAGLSCRTFWIDPCAGSTCDACGGEARFCSLWI